MDKRLPANTGNLLPVVAWLLTEDEVRTWKRGFMARL